MCRIVSGDGGAVSLNLLAMCSKTTLSVSSEELEEEKEKWAGAGVFMALDQGSSGNICRGHGQDLARTLGSHMTPAVRKPWKSVSDLDGCISMDDSHV